MGLVCQLSMVCQLSLVLINPGYLSMVLMDPGYVRNRHVLSHGQ